MSASLNRLSYRDQHLQEYLLRLLSKRNTCLVIATQDTVASMAEKPAFILMCSDTGDLLQVADLVNEVARAVAPQEPRPTRPVIQPPPVAPAPVAPPPKRRRLI